MGITAARRTRRIVALAGATLLMTAGLAVAATPAHALLGVIEELEDLVDDVTDVVDDVTDVVDDVTGDLLDDVGSAVPPAKPVTDAVNDTVSTVTDVVDDTVSGVGDVVDGAPDVIPAPEPDPEPIPEPEPEPAPPAPEDDPADEPADEPPGPEVPAPGVPGPDTPAPDGPIAGDDDGTVEIAGDDVDPITAPETPGTNPDEAVEVAVGGPGSGSSQPTLQPSSSRLGSLARAEAEVLPPAAAGPEERRVIVPVPSISQSLDAAGPGVVASIVGSIRDGLSRPIPSALLAAATTLLIVVATSHVIVSMRSGALAPAAVRRRSSSGRAR